VQPLPDDVQSYTHHFLDEQQHNIHGTTSQQYPNSEPAASGVLHTSTRSPPSDTLSAPVAVDFQIPSFDLFMVEEVYGQTMPACQGTWFEYRLQNDDKRRCVIVNPQRMPRNHGLYLPNTTQQRPIFQDDRSAWSRTQRCQLAGGRLLEMHLRTSVKGLS
jgi:hypothetical protein